MAFYISYYLFPIIAATTYIKSHPETTGNDEAFKTACGIDVSYTPDQIEDSVCIILFIGVYIAVLF